MRPIINGSVNFNTNIKLNVDESALDTKRVNVLIIKVHVDFELCIIIWSEKSDWNRGDNYAWGRDVDWENNESDIDSWQGCLDWADDRVESDVGKQGIGGGT